MNSIEVLDELLSDLSSFSLVTFGFSVTLFTLLYSFIISKRETLKEFSDKIKEGNKDPFLLRRSSLAKNFILRMRRISKHIIITIIIEIFNYILCIINKYFVSILANKKRVIFVNVTLTIVIIIYISIMLGVTIRDYAKNTKL